ncbi:hypothetical protein, partial [Streptomyces anulatus]|uniref:hypothetical protein n=1 Tax=Streptomyces anulatus TaxID=1892 RepID=UPI0036B58C44
ALAADGVLTQAYDTWAEPQNAPRPGMRVLATAARARNDARWRAAVTDCGIDPHRSYSRSSGPVRATDRSRTR